MTDAVVVSAPEFALASVAARAAAGFAPIGAQSVRAAAPATRVFLSGPARILAALSPVAAFALARIFFELVLAAGLLFVVLLFVLFAFLLFLRLSLAIGRYSDPRQRQSADNQRHRELIPNINFHGTPPND